MQINKEQVNALIQQGQKKGLTGKDVIDALIRKGYEPEGVNVPAIKEVMAKKIAPVETSEPSFVESLKQDLNTRVERTGAILNRPESSTLEKGTQLFGQGAGLAANAIEKTAEQIPGVKQAFGAVGAGINWLSESAPIKAIANQIGESKTLQEVTNLYDTDQNFKDSVDAVANIVRLGGDVQMAAAAVNFTKNVTNKIINRVETLKTSPSGTPPSSEPTPLLSPEGQALVDKVVPDSATIMNRVARLKPTDAAKFEKLTGGKTHGEYLTETGNFKAPDEIIKNESSKFSSTLQAKDAELAKLPGLFKDGSIDDALTGLVEKAKSTSGTNIKSPYLDQVLSLQNKAKTTGLTNEEINIVKRLYEKEVKLGYNKLLNADKVEQATNIDSALRAFQDETAKKLGFTNIPELNKQIQISKFLIDKLGDQIVGQNGLNGVGLSDWVILAGGDPTAVGAFLVKKFFSTKGIQAKIAEYLNKGKIKGQATPETTITPENINRQINPEGNLALPAPAEGASKVQINTPINLPAKSATKVDLENIMRILPQRERQIFYESLKPEQQLLLPEYKGGAVGTPINQPSRKIIEQGTEVVPRTSKPQSQSVPKKEIKTSNKSTTKSLKVKGETTNLISEAKKYKSAEEFVKAQPTVYHGSSNANIDILKPSDSKLSGGFGKVVSFADNPEYASNFAGSKGKVYEKYLDIQNPVILEKGQSIFDKFPNIPKKNGAEWLKNKGYDAIIAKDTSHGAETQVLNPNIIKTKSQLTDIWKKANKK